MGETRWCPKCESEFQPGISTCPDCGVALVGEPLPPDEPPTTTLAGHEPVAYELEDWPHANRDSLEWMLAGIEIPFEWDPPGVLIVPERRADEVEGFIDYLDALTSEDATATDGDREQGTETTAAEAVVGDAAPDSLRADKTSTEDTPARSSGELPAPLRWLEPQLDQLQRAYLTCRADRDPETAFETALATTLDEDSRARLESVFAGDEDEACGTGFGDRALHTMQNAFEQLAWVVAEPVPEGTPPRSANSPPGSTL
jgi:hypothetical protein